MFPMLPIFAIASLFPTRWPPCRIGHQGAESQDGGSWVAEQELVHTAKVGQMEQDQEQDPLQEQEQEQKLHTDNLGQMEKTWCTALLD